jgi:tRNA uridine 5-carbamoylmethylation protein Kti12
MEQPIVRMFHEEIRSLVDEFIPQRLADPMGERRSLVVILRGLPGSGKSTFATLLKIYAESRGLQAQICCADDYFIQSNGYKFEPGQLSNAHARCEDYCFFALQRSVPVVIIDNTNVTQF